jgi:hypothetical protein
VREVCEMFQFAVRKRRHVVMARYSGDGRRGCSDAIHLECILLLISREAVVS